VREVIGKVQRDGLFSAIQAVRSRLDQPQNPGYSSAGTVIAVGEGVTDVQPGDRVACAGAGFALHAEVACVPRLLIARIPSRSAGDEVPFEEAAFATLGAVALHGIRTAEAKIGDLVAVIGLGLLGQLTVQLLKAAGCRVLGMDIDSPRSELARQMGGDAVASSASAFRDLCSGTSHGMGVDSVLITAETSSSDPVNLGGAVARDRAIVVAVGTVGMDIERKTYYEKELDFRISRSYGPGRYDAAYEQKGRDYPIGYVRWTETRNMEAFVQLLAGRKINLSPVITHRFPVENASRAYDVITGNTRERFLGVIIQYPTACDQSSSLTFSNEPSKRTVGTAVSIGLLGAGDFASSTLIPAMKAFPGALLVSVCAATGSHAQHAARKFGFRNCTTDESELIHNPEITAVVIATRHHLHPRQVVAALGAGKSVFCEKPLCLFEEELREICVSYLGRPSGERPALMLGFNRRFAPMIARIKTFLDPVSEPLALHYRVNAGYLPPDHWVNDREQGGGRILGEVCHFVDLLAFLAGSSIVEASARPIGRSPKYSGENVLISLRFANGSEGTISYLANGDRSFSKERIEVFGGASTAVLEDFRRLELVRNGSKERIHSRWGQDKGHRAEWIAFARFLQEGGEPPIPFEQIVASSLATLRIDESVATGQPLAVNTAAFLDSIRPTSTLSRGMKD
jgi:predicted dehydrogenase/threonine dehydrogenase-like Zn-dependent dehydrogenase